ncbi:MAG: amidohydrolase family protein [Clostridia bacterium]|nr:amidohydrolase family protein [Clostridia bacterium]
MQNNLPVADSHVHAFYPKDDMYRVFDEMVSFGVKEAALLAYTYEETGIDNNIICLHYKENYQKMRLWMFGGLYYDKDIQMPFREQAELLLDMGADGIKFLEMKPTFNLRVGRTLDDPIYDEMFDMLETRGVPMTCHVADPAVFWHKELMSPHAVELGWCYEDERYMSHQEYLDAVLRRLDKNPNLKWIFAHFGYFTEQLDACWKIIEKYPNVMFDTTPGWEIYLDFAKNITGWKEFFEKNNRRIMYGTDTSNAWTNEHVRNLHKSGVLLLSASHNSFPIPHFPEYNMCGLELSKEAQRNILRENFIACMGKPKKVNIPLLKDHAGFLREIAVKNGDTSVIAAIDSALNDL